MSPLKKRCVTAIIAVLLFCGTAVVASAQTTLPAGQGPASTQAEAKGPTLSLSFDGSSNRYGQVMRLVPSGGYSLTKHFGVEVGMPWYFVHSTTPPGTPRENGIGDVFAGAHFTFTNPVVNFRTTLVGTAPTGDSSRGLSTGRATFDWTTHVDRGFGHLTPFVEGGLTNSLSDSRFFHRPFMTLGKAAHFEGGASFRILGPFSIGASAYDISPWGEQRVFSRLVRGSSTMASNNRRNFETSPQTLGAADLTRDNGYNGWVDFALGRAVLLEAGYSRSVPLHLDTVSFGLKVNVGAAMRRGSSR